MRRARTAVRLVAALAGALVLGAGAARVPELLAGMEAFRLDGFRLEGARFVTLEDALAVVQPPPDASIWDDADPWLAPLRTHPLVEAVEVRRRLPDSLVLEVTEVEPVALLATPVLEPVDADGRPLPIDPSQHRLDLPLLRTPDREAVAGLARELRRLDEADPGFVSMLSELIREESGDVVALWGQPGVAIRFRPPLPGDRLLQAMAVIADASARYSDRRLRAVDLRYAEQVVVRF